MIKQLLVVTTRLLVEDVDLPILSLICVSTWCMLLYCLVDYCAIFITDVAICNLTKLKVMNIS